MPDEITLRKYAKGETIVAMGGAATDLYIVVRGEVGISRSGDPRDAMPFTVLRPGSMFGESMMFPGMRHRGYAHALTEALVVIVPQEKLGELGDTLM